MKLIIDIPKEDLRIICERTEKEINEEYFGVDKRLIEAVQNGIPFEFGNLSDEAIEESSHCPACVHYVQGDVPNVFCEKCVNRDELYRRIENETDN